MLLHTPFVMSCIWGSVLWVPKQHLMVWCVNTFMCVPMGVCTCGGPKDASVSCLLQLNLNLSWSCSLGPLSLFPTCRDYRWATVSTCTAFCVGSGDLNSSPHPCFTGALFVEPSRSLTVSLGNLVICCRDRKLTAALTLFFSSCSTSCP